MISYVNTYLISSKSRLKIGADNETKGKQSCASSCQWLHVKVLFYRKFEKSRISFSSTLNKIYDSNLF